MQSPLSHLPSPLSHSASGNVPPSGVCLSPSGKRPSTSTSGFSTPPSQKTLRSEAIDSPHQQRSAHQLQQQPMMETPRRGQLTPAKATSRPAQGLPPPIPSPAMLGASNSINTANPLLQTPKQTPRQSPVHAAMSSPRHHRVLSLSGSKSHPGNPLLLSGPKANWMSALSLATGSSPLPSAGVMSLVSPKAASPSASPPSSNVVGGVGSVGGGGSTSSPAFDRFIPARRQLAKAIALAQTHANEDAYHQEGGVGQQGKENALAIANAQPPSDVAGTALELLERQESKQQFTNQLAASLLNVHGDSGRAKGRAMPRALFGGPNDGGSAASAAASSSCFTFAVPSAAAASHATEDHQASLSFNYRSTDSGFGMGLGGGGLPAPLEPLLASPLSPPSLLSPPRHATVSTPGGSAGRGHARAQSFSFSAGVVPSAVRVLAARQAFISKEAVRILDCPGLLNDYYLNLVHWSARTGVLAIALASEIYLWNQATATIDSLTSGSESDVDDPVASLRWSEDGVTLAVGYKSAVTKLFDVASKRVTQTMHSHAARVSALDWSGSSSPWMLASGGQDTLVKVHDVRLTSGGQDNVVAVYGTHREEVCGLAFSPDGSQLASGANDNKLCIWNLRASQTSSSSSSPFANSNTSSAHLALGHHRAAVKALAWCPWQEHVLASGGGLADGHIRFCHSITGLQTHSVDTSSQVCSLQWSRSERELLSAHGHPDHTLVVWKFPELSRVATLKGHAQRVLHTGLSPDGSTVVSAAADETLRFWKIWRPTQPPKKENKVDAWIRTSPMHRPIR